MKKIIFTLSAAALFFVYSCKKDSPINSDPVKTDTLSGAITQDKILTENTRYVLKGKVYVKNNATLTISKGVEVDAVKYDNAADKSALIVTAGSKIQVNGTADLPVVFTSAAAVKAPGDWIGLIVLGKAPTNLGVGHIAGLPESADTQFGADVANDNSGSLKYLRIEYAGGLNPAMETEWNLDLASGLSLEGVGAATQVDHIMVSHSRDDAFQFVGGTVNASYLIANHNGDDGFDFDRGYTGKLQFLISYNSTPSTVAIRANGMESLNDKDASDARPYTRPVISNMTIIGPEGTDAASNQSQGIYIRRNTRFLVRNSIIAGYSNGGLMMCPKTKPLLLNNAGSQFKYNFVNCDDVARAFTYDDGPSGVNIIPDPQVATYATEMDDASIEKPAVNKNKIVNSIADLNLKVLYSATAPDLSPVSGALELSGADFADPEYSTFFAVVSYRGAVGTENWAAPGNWVKWN